MIVDPFSVQIVHAILFILLYIKNVFMKMDTFFHAKTTQRIWMIYATEIDFNLSLSDSF